MQYNYTGDDLSDTDEFPTESSSEQPIVSPNVADADSQDCPPAGEVRSGKKRKRTGAQRAAKKAALKHDFGRWRLHLADWEPLIKMLTTDKVRGKGERWT